MTPGSTDPPHAGRPTCARIDLEAFAHNVRLAVRLAGPDRRVLAVVKADAYGHGAVPVARARTLPVTLSASKTCSGRP